MTLECDALGVAEDCPDVIGLAAVWACAGGRAGFSLVRVVRVYDVHGRSLSRHGSVSGQCSKGSPGCLVIQQVAFFQL